MINLTPGWTKSGPFFPKPRHFFDIQKQGRFDLPLLPANYMPDIKDFHSRIME